MRKKKTKIAPTKNKINQLKHHFILTIRNASGFVLDTITHTDYDIIILEGMERSKEVNGFWEVYNSLGKRIDGNYDRRTL
jgi:hypothetical protein